MTIEKEDFEQWLGHPVTEQVMRAHKWLAEQAKEKWIAASWDGGQADPLLLADLRARAEVIKDFTSMTFEDIEEDEEREHERNSANRV